MIIALLIAIGLWVYVVGVENPEKDIQIKDVPITFVNEETLGEGGLTILSVSDSVVDVQVKGALSEIKKVSRNDIKIVADLEGYKEGEHTIRLQIGRINNVEIDTKQKISIIVDQLITAEKPVAVSMDGSISDDIEPYIVQVSQPKVSVTGAMTLVNRIEKVDAALDIGKVGSELKSFTVNLRPVDGDGETVRNVQLSAKSVSVSAVNLNKKTVRLDVPVTGVESLDVERNVTLPKTITIKGLNAELSEISLITAEVLDLSRIYEDTVLDVVPILPAGVEVASDSQKLQAQVMVRGMDHKTFEYSKEDVIAEGVDKNMTVTLEDVDIVLNVTGSETVVEPLTGDEFSFVVNVRNLKPGNHRVILNCRYDMPLSLVEFEPEVVTVHIAEQGETEEPGFVGEPNDSDAAGTSGTDADDEAKSENKAETETEQEPESVPEA